MIIEEATLPNWPAGFHLQQAAEKCLKAVLVASGRTAPRSHDLSYLADEVAALKPALSGWADRIAALSDYGVAQRYPGGREPTLDLRAALADIADLVQLATQVCSP